MSGITFAARATSFLELIPNGGEAIESHEIDMPCGIRNSNPLGAVDCKDIVQCARVHKAGVDLSSPTTLAQP